LRIAGRLKPELVHLNGFREGAIAWPCPSVVVAHSCVLSWWHATKGEWPTGKRWSAYADAAAAGIDAATAWVAPTNAFRRSIEQIYRPRQAGFVIANGIPPRELSSVTKQAMILASGRIWDDGKNLLALAEVAQELPWPVHIAGAGPADDDGLPRRNVTWLGEIAHADLRRHMQTSAIYAAPALYEPFGLGILEAAQAGCALVLSDIDSLRELWDGAALHVPPGDAERLRRILQRLCRQTSLRHHLQKAAASRARHYSIEQMLSRYVELYRRVLAPARRHRPETPEDAEAAA
jgi:glycosyltransferase involved in cell wall biosynthesis